MRRRTSNCPSSHNTHAVSAYYRHKAQQACQTQTNITHKKQQGRATAEITHGSTSESSRRLTDGSERPTQSAASGPLHDSPVPSGGTSLLHCACASILHLAMLFFRTAPCITRLLTAHAATALCASAVHALQLAQLLPAVPIGAPT